MDSSQGPHTYLSIQPDRTIRFFDFRAVGEIMGAPSDWGEDKISFFELIKDDSAG